MNASRVRNCGTDAQHLHLLPRPRALGRRSGTHCSGSKHGQIPFARRRISPAGECSPGRLSIRLAAAKEQADPSSGENALQQGEQLLKLASGISDAALTAEDAAAILSQLDTASLSRVDAETWATVADRAADEAPNLTPNAVTGLAHAYARAEAAEAPAALLNALSKRVVTKPRKFTPPQLSTITWAFAKLKQPCSDLFFTVMVQLEGQPAAFGARGFSDVIWSLGTTGWLTADLLRKVGPSLQELVPQMTPAQLEQLFEGIQAVPGGAEALGLNSAGQSNDS